MYRNNHNWYCAGLLSMIIVGIGFGAIEPLFGQSDWTSNTQRFEAFSDREVLELKNKKERFDKMPIERQQMLRDLHSEIQSHENRDELLMVMNEFYAWLKTLSGAEREEVLSLPPQQRIAAIKRLRQIQAEKNFGRSGETQLPGKDIAVLFQWRSEIVQSKGEQIVGIVTKILEDRQRMDSVPRRYREPKGAFEFLGRFRPESIDEIITPADVQDLRGKLSSDAVRIIERQTEESDQRKLVARWLVATLRAERTPTKSQIQKIIEGLDNEDRLALDRMSEADRMREYARRYNFGNPETSQQFRDRRRRGSPDGRRRGPRIGSSKSKRESSSDDNR